MAKKPKLTEVQEKMREAVASLAKYVSTYDQQYGYLDYSEKCYIDDILYGLGRSLGVEYEFAGGFEVFKAKLREHLREPAIAPGTVCVGNVALPSYGDHGA